MKAPLIRSLSTRGYFPAQRKVIVHENWLDDFLPVSGGRDNFVETEPRVQIEGRAVQTEIVDGMK